MAEFVESGRCLCEAVKYRVTARPFASDYCHCRMCQRSTGAPVSAWMDFKTEQVQWLQRDDLTEYASSENLRRGFCQKCGSTLTYRSVKHQYVSIAVTSLDNPELVKPTYHIYTDSQLPWFEIADSCKRYSQAQQ